MAFTSEEIKGFDFVQHYVGNARHSAYYYARLYGFDIAGYLGPETGVRDRVSYLLKREDLMFTITAAIVPEHEIHHFVMRHGDGIREITFRVVDVYNAFDHATANGAEAYQKPAIEKDSNGTLVRASIKIYGDTILTFVDRTHYQGDLPGYEPYEGPQMKGEDTGLVRIDHIVGNVEEGQMNYWADFFGRTADLETFIHFDKGDISTQYSSLVSKVVRSKKTTVRLPINEPAEGIKKSQIEEYLDVNYGAGVQHIAIETKDIVSTIRALRANGVNFIGTPNTYYDVIGSRADGIDEEIADLKELDILLDRDEKGYLLQLFTQPVNDRPTLFYEIIERKGCDGFGQNNFQSLFESIEREQARRGNL